jgi:cellulose synthase/poly-beta-1,6-N-acetylglucosamine synthase-like glycosyltransferase
MHALSVALAAWLSFVTVSLLASGLYAVGIVALSVLRNVANRERVITPHTDPHIAVVIVAHDEERVITASVRSLMAQRYPEDSFAVFVVADRCTDRTRELASAAGARVISRTDGRDGKAAAVAFAVEAVFSNGTFDAIAIFDADNTADPGFLRAVSQRFSGGARVVQGFVDAMNPGASWVAGSSALGFWAIAALAQAPRERLGLAPPLMGTGFVIHADDAARFLTDAESLTDDVELGARLALEGIRVTYEPEARVFDEKPVKLGTAISQRHRWMQGRWAVAGRYLPRLVRRAFSSNVPLGVRVRMLDAAAQLVSPSLSFTAVATLVTGTFVVLLARVLPPVFAHIAFAVPPEVSLAAGFVFYAVPALSIARFRPPARVWLYYALQPAYLALSAPLALSGFLTRRSGRWNKTPKG